MATRRGVTLDPEQVSLPARGWAARLPLVAGGVGVAAAAGALLLGAGDRAQLLHSWLVAFLFFVSLALGGLFFVLLQHLTRAGWSVVVRRLAEHVAATMPLFLLLLLPLAFGLHDLYHWSHAEAVAADPLLQHKQPWLNAPFFLTRAVAYLLLWSAMAWWLRRQSQRQDQMGAVVITRRLQRLSAPGMVLFGVTLTLASFDWIMSLDPHWYSTVFGVYFFSGSAVGIFALLIVLALALQRAGALRGVVTFEHFHDLGKLLFGFVVFWAYIAFSQFMLIWYANIPEETAFYAHRWHHGWQTLSIALAVGHFGLPFFLLLLRDVKRHRLGLWAAASWLLVMHWLDLYWLVMPALHEDPAFHLLDPLCLLAVGGLFTATLAALLRRPALVPIQDPRLAESMAFENV
ncbi:MAG TPA: quinol:cytochrome C oxidoreductase [Thermoanaerobaculia bacterium]|nr:quinol:cytochrome C oxidoreductase [Thermoanaerobaculia bacterium]